MAQMHNMRAFFSNVDMQELQDNVDKYPYYLSLIVNFDGNYCAKVCWLAKDEGSKPKVIKTVWGNYTIEGTESNEYLMTSDCIIEFEENHFIKNIKDLKSSKIKPIDRFPYSNPHIPRTYSERVGKMNSQYSMFDSYDTMDEKEWKETIKGKVKNHKFPKKKSLDQMLNSVEKEVFTEHDYGFGLMEGFEKLPSYEANYMFPNHIVEQFLKDVLVENPYHSGTLEQICATFNHRFRKAESTIDAWVDEIDDSIPDKYQDFFLKEGTPAELNSLLEKCVTMLSNYKHFDCIERLIDVLSVPAV